MYRDALSRGLSAATSMLKTAATTPPLWAKREGFADGTEERKVVAPTTTFEGKLTYH